MMNNKSATPMSDEEAASVVRHIEFEKYLDSETDDVREARQDRHESNRAKFQAIIEGAGYQRWERERIAELEAQLPSAHKKKQSKHK